MLCVTAEIVLLQNHFLILINFFHQFKFKNTFIINLEQIFF